MKIIDYLKNYINKIKNKKLLLLDTSKDLYSDLISNSKINTIIDNIPSDLSEIEKAYYIYLELGKIVGENPYFVFTDRKGKEDHYNDKIDDKYFGICKSISELYVGILRDKRVGISADLVKKNPESSIGHIDTILKIDGKNYVVNLISDLSRIKTSRRVNSFGYDLNRFEGERKIIEESYLKNLESYYGRIDYLTRGDIENLDKKLQYSFTQSNDSKDNERGIYTEDTIELLKKDMDNQEVFKEYVLHNQDVKESEVLKYKLDYIFENINKFTDYNSNLNYLENIRYYIYVARKILSPQECSRIQVYAVTKGNDVSDIISVLKVKPIDTSKDENLYYMYSKEENKYLNKTPEEMKKIMKELQIVGIADRFSPRKNEELEL